MTYANKRESERARNAAKSRKGRDVGELPPVKNPKRRKAAERSLRYFLEKYFPADFSIPWSADHLKLIAEIERIVLSGSLKAIAMPRGTGKTTILERAAIWAVLIGKRFCVMVIGATGDAALEILETIKYEFDGNDLLCEDWPEVCIPIRMLEGLANRAAGQHINGKRTRITWGLKSIVLPTVAGSKCSGAAIVARGLLGRVRGYKRKADKRTIRPDLALIDDVQTDATAKSDGQITKRLRVMTGAVLNLAGPKVKMAAICSLTVIQPGDVADQLLDRDAHPEWDGLRTKMLYGEPKHQELIDQYWELRAEDMRTGSTAAVKFYAANRSKIEAGYTAAWPERYNDDEVSAIQNALHLIQDRGQDVFDAEFQNEPKAESARDEWYITADEIRSRLSGVPRSIVPVWATRLTAFIDLQQRLLYYAVAAFDDDPKNPRGSIIEYGTWPSQKAREFTYREARSTLSKSYPKRGVKGSIRAGLADLTNNLLDRRWLREDNAEQRIQVCGIDAGNWTDLVHEFARTNSRAQLLLPTKGAGITADKRPISEYRKNKGSIIGNEWMLTPAPKHASRLLMFDSNFWKRELFIKFATPLGDAGGMTLAGDDPDSHKLIAAHFRAESPTRTEGGGRTVHVFHEQPSRPDNHLLDCAVGCVVLTFHNLVGHRRRRTPRKAKPI